VVSLLAQQTEKFQGVVFTAYADNCSCRTHHAHLEETREQFINAVTSLVGGDDVFRIKLRGIIATELIRMGGST
jgi:hypothetical protein